MVRTGCQPTMQSKSSMPHASYLPVAPIPAGGIAHKNEQSGGPSPTGKNDDCAGSQRLKKTKTNAVPGVVQFPKSPDSSKPFKNEKKNENQPKKKQNSKESTESTLFPSSAGLPKHQIQIRWNEIPPLEPHRRPGANHRLGL